MNKWISSRVPVIQTGQHQRRINFWFVGLPFGGRFQSSKFPVRMIWVCFAGWLPWADTSCSMEAVTYQRTSVCFTSPQNEFMIFQSWAHGWRIHLQSLHSFSVSRALPACPLPIRQSPRRQPGKIPTLRVVSARVRSSAPEEGPLRADTPRRSINQSVNQSADRVHYPAINRPSLRDSLSTVTLTIRGHSSGRICTKGGRGRFRGRGRRRCRFIAGVDIFPRKVPFSCFFCNH